MSTASALPRSVLEPGARYQEAGECGRWRVRSGDVLLHAPFSAHWDLAPARGAKVLNLPVTVSVERSACGQVDDLDQVIRLAERDPVEAATALLQGWRWDNAPLMEPPDLLARDLSVPGARGIRAWCQATGVSRATVYRWSRAAYGVGPTRYRTEARSRRAWQMIVHGAAGLAEIAGVVGYADQAHMTRGVKAFTGRAPGVWRSGSALQRSFKTRSAPA